MEAPEEPGTCRISLLIAREVLEAIKERVNDDDVGIQTVNSWRDDEVEPKSMDPATPRAENPIHQKPDEKLQKMGTWEGRNFVPKDGLGIPSARPGWLRQREIFNALSIKMNLTMSVPREAFEQFGESALGAMSAINER
jgi:hypothetical protein